MNTTHSIIDNIKAETFLGLFLPPCLILYIGMVHRLGEMYFQTDFGHTRWQPMRPSIMRIIHSRRTRTPLVVPSTTISRAELDLAK
jgi:hypothetical protein